MGNKSNICVPPRPLSPLPLALSVVSSLFLTPLWLLAAFLTCPPVPCCFLIYFMILFLTVSSDVT